jgi:hypothetical protein
MASSLVNRDAVRDETFLPGQIFVFGGFALWANSLGHLEQIESYAPGHQVRFGSLNYTADIRGDLIFDGFEPQPGTPHCLDGYDLALPPGGTLEAAPTPAPTLSSEPTAPIENGWLDTASGAAVSTAIEPNTSIILCTTRDPKVPDSLPDPEPSAPLPIESEWAPIMEFTAADIFQHLPFGDILNSLRSLSLSGEPWPDYGQQDWMRTTKKSDAHPPPTS